MIVPYEICTADQGWQSHCIEDILRSGVTRGFSQGGQAWRGGPLIVTQA